MPDRYRKKPVVIEAVRYVPMETCEEVAEFMGLSHHHEDCYDDAKWVIETLEGTMFANHGDWIIKGVQGEFYPCKPDIFEATYEPADTKEPTPARRGGIMTRIKFDCDRCNKRISGLHTATATAGFYNVSAGTPWARFAKNPSEHFVCDGCIQSMPEYQAVYGKPA